MKNKIELWNSLITTDYNLTQFVNFYQIDSWMYRNALIIKEK